MIGAIQNNTSAAVAGTTLKIFQSGRDPFPYYQPLIFHDGMKKGTSPKSDGVVERSVTSAVSAIHAVPDLPKRLHLAQRYFYIPDQRTVYDSRDERTL